MTNNLNIIKVTFFSPMKTYLKTGKHQRREKVFAVCYDRSLIYISENVHLFYFDSDDIVSIEKMPSDNSLLHPLS